jgi:hypothetical protein
MTEPRQPATDDAPKLTHAGVMFLLEHRKVCPVDSLTIREALVAIGAEAHTQGWNAAVREMLAAVERSATNAEPAGEPGPLRVGPPIGDRRFPHAPSLIRPPVAEPAGEPPRRFATPNRCGWCGSKGEHLPDCDNPNLARPPVAGPDAGEGE